MTHEELKKIALQNPDVKDAYEALESEFEYLRQTFKVRQKHT